MKRIFIFILPILLLKVMGCTPILSKRTDVQAWNEYHRDQKSKRGPAEVAKTKLSRTDLTELHQALDQAPVRDFLLSCNGLESCYQSKLTLYFDQTYQKIQSRRPAASSEKSFGTDYKDEQKLFFHEQAFGLIKEEVHAFHQLLLSGLELRASDRIHDLNLQCESSTKDGDKSIEFSPFLAGLTYIPRGEYACLNAHWQSDAEQLQSETADRLGVVFTTKEARDWIVQQEIYPIYFQETTNVIQKKQQKEMGAWSSELPSLKGKAVHDSQCLSKSVKQWTPILREKYHYLNLEALLTTFFTQECKS